VNPTPLSLAPGHDATSSPDAVALSWLVMVRWTGIVAEVAAVAAGWRGFGAPASFALPATVIGLSAVSNVWLASRLRRPPAPALAIGGGLVAADVVALSWLLLDSGGVLNPVSIFYLVDIVLAALVLGRTWTWIVTTLSVCGYGALFLLPSRELRTALTMHPEIGMHIDGMWLAFAATALIVAVLVARLATLVERRDRALADMRERQARDARLIGLATLAAGAAHELSTPLGTIAVAARELERSLDTAAASAGDRREDIQLIRAEIERCRRVLNDMASRSGGVAGEAPTPRALADLASDVLAQIAPDERPRVDVSIPGDVTIRWPAAAVTRALANIVRNGLHASPPDGRVTLAARREPPNRVLITIADRGHGMAPDVRARAGEPFYTTKPEGSGMGLGLFVATSTIDQLGGTLRVASTEGVGTRVDVALPADVAIPDAHA
jgi:two-component system sensor histidine kinase RegB